MRNTMFSHLWFLGCLLSVPLYKYSTNNGRNTTFFNFHKMLNIFQLFVVYLCWYNTSVHLHWYNTFMCLCVCTHQCIWFDKMHRYQTCFLFWRSVIYLDHILITYLFDGPSWLLMKEAWYELNEQNISQHDGRTSRLQEGKWF